MKNSMAIMKIILPPHMAWAQLNLIIEPPVRHHPIIMSYFTYHSEYMDNGPLQGPTEHEKN